MGSKGKVSHGQEENWGMVPWHRILRVWRDCQLEYVKGNGMAGVSKGTVIEIHPKMWDGDKKLQRMSKETDKAVNMSNPELHAVAMKSHKIKKYQNHEQVHQRNNAL